MNVAVKLSAEDLASRPLTIVVENLKAVETAARLAGGAAGNFSREANAAAEASARAAKAHGEHGFSLEHLGKSFASATEMAFSFGLGMAALNAGAEIFNRLKESLIDLPEEFESARISFETFAGSADAAQKLLGQVQGLGSRDPFGTQALLGVSRTLIALGTPASEVASHVQDIATAVAAVGGTDQDLQRVALTLGRLSETGILDARVMRSLVAEQIPAWQILGQGLGKTKAELDGMLKSGEITSDVFQRAFHTWATSGDVAEVLGKRAETASGSMTVFKNAMQEATVTALAPFSRELSVSAKTLDQFAASGKLQQWAIQVANLLGGLDKETFPGTKNQLDYVGMAAEKTASQFDALTKSSSAMTAGLGNVAVASATAGADLDTLAEHAARARQMLADVPHRWEDAAAAQKVAADSSRDAARATEHDTVAQMNAMRDTALNSAYTVSGYNGTLNETAHALGGVGQNALVAIAGLSALDMVIAGTEQDLAKVQLQIEEKVLARMERRPAVTLYQQEALLSERLKVEQLEKAAGFTVAQESLKISNAQAHAARLPHHASGADWIVGGTGGPDSQYVQFMASPDERVTVTPAGGGGQAISFASLFGAGSIIVQTVADAARVGAMVEAKLTDLISGAGLSNGRANRQLAGVR